MKSPSLVPGARWNRIPRPRPRHATCARSHSRRNRELRTAQDRHAPLGHRSRPLGNLHFGAQLGRETENGHDLAQLRYAGSGHANSRRIRESHHRAGFRNRDGVPIPHGVRGNSWRYLAPHDAFPADDHADLELPARPSLTVTVYSNQPELLKPLLASTPRVTAIYRKPGEYRANDTGLVILDRFIPPQRPAADSIWIDPPASGSPIPVRSQVSDVAFGGWDSTPTAAAGLRTKDFKLEQRRVRGRAG